MRLADPSSANWPGLIPQAREVLGIFELLSGYSTPRIRSGALEAEDNQILFSRSIIARGFSSEAKSSLGALILSERLMLRSLASCKRVIDDIGSSMLLKCFVGNFSYSIFLF